MPNGLGAILAALAGGAEGYTNLKQREREEALEAERRAREEQDRQEQKAFQQFEMERELRKMGGRYTDEMGPGTRNPDPPSLVKMDRVEAALLGTANALPPRADGTPRGPLKIGLTPNAANIGIEPNKERVRMASQAIEVPGSGGKRVYLPTADELGDQAFARTQRQGKIDRGVIAGEVAAVTADERANQRDITKAANAFTAEQNRLNRVFTTSNNTASQNTDIRQSIQTLEKAYMKGTQAAGSMIFTGMLPPAEARRRAIADVAEVVGADAVLRATGAKAAPSPSLAAKPSITKDQAEYLLSDKAGRNRLTQAQLDAQYKVTP